MLFEETFDGLADETAVTGANTNFSGTTITGTGAAVADTAFSVAGGVSVRVSTTVDGDLVRLIPSHAVSDPVAVRFYFRPDFYPSTGTEGETNIAEARNSLNIVRAMMEFKETGEIGIKDNNVLAASSTTALPVDQWTRIEWKLDATTDTQTCRLFIGSNMHGTVPDEEFSGAFTQTGDISIWWLGQVRKTFAMTAWWDEIAVAADWPGSAVTGPTTLVDWTTGPLPSTTGSTVVLDTTAGFPSADSISIQQAASSQAYASWNTGAATTALRFYMKMPAAWSTTSSQIAGLGGSGVTEFRVSIGGSGSPGQIRLRTVGDAPVVQSTTGVIANDTWYRIELQANAPASQARLAVFPTGSTTALWDSGWQTDANFATVPTKIVVGRPAASPTLGTFLVDSVFATDSVADWIGPVEGDINGPLIEWTDGPLPNTAGSSVTLDTVNGFPSADSISITQAGGSAAYAYWDTGASQTAVRFYIRTPSAWTSTSAKIATIDGPEAWITITGTGAPGAIRLGSSGNLAASPNGTIANDTWYRMELQVDTTVSQARLAVFATGSTIPLWDSGWQTDANFTTLPTRVSLGAVNTSPTMGTFLMDSIMATDSVADWIGPVEGDNPPGATVEVWDGSTLQPVASVGVWNGTSLQSIDDITVV